MLKRILCTTAATFMLLPVMLTSCSGPADDVQDSVADTTTAAIVQDTTTEAPETTVPAPVSLTLLDGKKSDFKLIRSDDSSDAITKSVTNMFKTISEYTGGTFMLNTDWERGEPESVQNDNAEILIGHTNRAESIEVLNSLAENSYAVAIKNNKLVIIGTDDNMTVLALFDFVERILKNTSLCSEGKLVIGEEDCFTVTRDAKMTLPEMIKGNYAITSTDERVITCKGVDQYKIGQGAASDGTYAYFALRNSNDTGSVICKYRLDDGTFVAKSDVLDLGHANDMTFDTAKNQLVVAHGQSEGKILTIVDPDTLAFIKDVNITHGSGAITYSVGRGSYAISQGGSTLHMMTAELKHVKSYSRITGTGYTAQGMGSDEDYIYFPMSGKNDNILQVYDWEGNYATVITVPIDMESESMFWVNNTYYIAFNHSGSEILHRIDFCIIYQQPDAA